MKCWVESGVLAFITAECQRIAPKESGGLLLGYWAAGDVIVRIATGAGPESNHNLSSYIPDNKFDSDQIAKFYKETRGIITYLGDWHSHPGGGSDLSKDDVITLINISTYEPARAATPIMLIAAKEHYGWTPAVWIIEIIYDGKGEYYPLFSPVQILRFSQ